MKHATAHTSPLQGPSRYGQALLHNFRRMMQRAVMLIALIIIGGGGLFLGLFILVSEPNHQKITLFSSEIINGKINQKILAYNDAEKEKLLLYAIPAAIEVSPIDQTLTDIEADQKKREMELSLRLGTLVNDHVILSELETTDSLTTEHELEKALWQELQHTQPLSTKFWQLLQWWWYLRSLSVADLSERQFDSIEAFQAYALENDIRLSTAPCSIAVVNTSAQAGVAAQVGEVLERNGLFVVRLTDNQTETAGSLLLREGESACDRVVQLLKTLTPNSPEPAINPEVAQEYRARIVILVGQDMIRYLE